MNERVCEHYFVVTYNNFHKTWCTRPPTTIDLIKQRSFPVKTTIHFRRYEDAKGKWNWYMWESEFHVLLNRWMDKVLSIPLTFSIFMLLAWSIRAIRYHCLISWHWQRWSIKTKWNNLSLSHSIGFFFLRTFFHQIVHKFTLASRLVYYDYE